MSLKIDMIATAARIFLILFSDLEDVIKHLFSLLTLTITLNFF